MQINCPEKLLKAMEFVQEQKHDYREKCRRQIQDIFSVAYEASNSESADKEAFEKIQDQLESLNKLLEEAPMLDSLNDCMTRVLRWEANTHKYHAENPQCPICEYTISSDFGEHTFFFSEHRPDGRNGLCGGIVFHGLPSVGYSENGSVQLEPAYGWQTHT